jgi:hypothetical protein
MGRLESACIDSLGTVYIVIIKGRMRSSYILTIASKLRDVFVAVLWIN